MSKPRFMISALAAVLVCATAIWTCTAAPDEKKGDEAKAPALPNCPVMGEPVDFNVKTSTKDGPVYFCCKGCIAKYEKEPAKYAKQVTEQRAALAKLPRIQVTCPISDKPVNKKISVDQDGKKVYLCCNRCPGEYKKDPAKYAAKLEECYTYQTRCPVMDEEIDPRSSMTTPDGIKVYFCCDDCIATFEKDPAKYAPKLEAQGTHIDLKKFKAKS